MRRFCGIFLTAVSLLFFVSASAIEIAGGGVARCVIVGDPGSAAVYELQRHLKKITGYDFTCHSPAERPSGIPAICLVDKQIGNNPDAWSYRTSGGDLILTGNLYYAVAEFLEKELGCHWFTFESEVIPQKKEIRFSSLNRSGSPAFQERAIFMPSSAQKMPEAPVLRCLKLNKYAYVNGLRMNFTNRLPRSHSFYDLVDPDLYFKDHPELFSMNSAGKRYRGPAKRVDGQLCLTNQETIRIAVEKLLRLIALDRKVSRTSGTPVPNVYPVSQNDNTSFICLCPQCKAVAEEEGGEGGLLIRFINKIADEVAKIYPDVMILTDAYVATEKAPLKARPRKNVIVRIADLYTKSDCYRPLTHPVNREQLAFLRAWEKLGCRLAVWDYWNMAIYNGPYFRPPRVETIIDAIIKDIPLYHKAGVISYFGEAEAQLYRVMPNFYDLQTWVAYKLMDTPDADAEALISTFMKGHYGPAAPAMSRFLALLRKKVAAEPEPMYYLRNSSRSYQTPAFFKEVLSLLEEAEAACPAKSAYFRRVQKEFLPVLGVLLVSPEMRGEMPRQRVAEKYRQCRLAQVVPFYGKKELTEIRKEIDAELLEVPVPEEFSGKGKRIVSLAYPSFTKVGNDPVSVFGKAQIPGTLNSRRQHKLEKVSGCYPTSFGLYDWETKASAALHLDNIPGDEKYHWYRVGSMMFGRRTMLWSWWWQIRCDLSHIWSSPDGRSPECNRYEVWIHLRITGPAYVPGSKSKNCIYMDQVLLISSEK